MLTYGVLLLCCCQLHSPTTQKTTRTAHQIPMASHGEIIYGDTTWIEDDCPVTFSEYIFLYPAYLMISHWLTENAEINSLF